MSKRELLIKEGFSRIEHRHYAELIMEVVENKNLKGFLKISTTKWFENLSEKEESYLKNLIKVRTDWFENKNVIKKLIVSGSKFLRWVENRELVFKSLIEVFNESDENELHSMWIDEKSTFSFDELVKDEESLGLFLSKDFLLNLWFNGVDAAKIPDKFYQDEKYWKALFTNFRWRNPQVLVKKLPTNWMKNEKLWKSAWELAVDYYGLDIKNYIDKKQLLSAKVINYFINKFRDYSLFKKYYNEIINNDELMEGLLAWEGNYKLLKYIKNKDFYKVRNIVMNRIKYLEEELEE